MKKYLVVVIFFTEILLSVTIHAQIGKRFPSERKEVIDPVTGTKLLFLTSTQSGDSKIYQTHNQWTSDGQWLIFRSNRVRGEAMAVNEKTGDIVQVTEGGYTGMLNIARKSMKLYFMRNAKNDTIPTSPGDTARRRVHSSSPSSAISPPAPNSFGVVPQIRWYTSAFFNVPALLSANSFSRSTSII